MSEPTLPDTRTLHEYEGGPLGYWCKGHVDAETFRRALAQSHDIEHSEFLSADDVRQKWWRNVPIYDGDGMMFHDAEPGSRGAYRVTVVDRYSYEADSAADARWKAHWAEVRNAG